MHGEPSARHGQGSDDETERSANACHVLAGVAQSLGEALGPGNEDSEAFLRWATELQTHVRHLRARSGDASAPAVLRVVR